MEDRKIRVAITHGDTNGIGYELIFKTFAEPEMLELCTPIIYGSPKTAAYHRKALDVPAGFSIIGNAEEAVDGRVNLLTTYEEEVKVELGTPTDESGNAALLALDRAMTDFRSSLYDVLVTAPVDNSHIRGFNGQTGFIEKSISEGKKSMTLLLNEGIRIGLATDNLPLKDVPHAITSELVKERATTLYSTIRRDFRLSNPRIAVLALNPDTTGNGKEEIEIIQPTVQELADNGLNVFGPFGAEHFFGSRDYVAFDGILAMYHDQGLVPFNTLTPTQGVKYTAGLDLIRTSPCHGAAFDIAGKGIADELSFRHANYTAIDAFRNRHNYDAPMGNPLKKLYHEKREDSDKARFTIPKKHENSVIEK